MTYTVTCPGCGDRTPWEPPARAPATSVPLDEGDAEAGRGVRVRCLARPPGVTRQLRRAAERSGRPLVCGTEFVVRPLPPDDTDALDSGEALPDPDRPPAFMSAGRGLRPLVLLAALAACAAPAPRGGR